MKAAVITVCFLIVFSSAESAQAAIPAVYTNDNYWTSLHDKPISFVGDGQGNFTGLTETGKIFRQITIETPPYIHLQKFMIDEAFFYISDKGTIKASSDLTAISIYLTKST